MLTSGALATFAVALLTITNPIGNLAIFASLTGDRDDAQKKAIATKSALAVALILVIVTWSGSYILDLFGISVPAFQTAGGLIILLLGLAMLHSQTSAMHHTPDEQAAAETKDEIAVVPMAIPIVAGPGAMTTIIVQSHQTDTIVDRLLVTAVCLGISLLLLLAFRFAAPIGRRLGVSGINIVTRIMGMVLSAIAIGMIASGLKQLFPGWA
jgi:multiple antibiotic resistance protein